MNSPNLHCVIVGSALGDSEFIPFTTLNEASRAFRFFCDENGFGARDAGSCYIYNGNKIVARVSYNGKVWEGSTYKPGAAPLFDPCVS
jgi:hypothetical protein